MGSLGIGIVGTGVVAHQHVAALGNVDAVRIAAVFDTDPVRARETSRAWGAVAADSVQDLVDDSSVDAVIVATPPGAHVVPTVAALEAGKHVLCEKPLARTVSDAEQIVKAAGASSVIFACCSGRLRHVPAHVEAVRLRERGELGDVYHVRYGLSMLRRRPGHHVLPQATWFLDRERAGGGALLDLGVYCVDAALSLLGHPEVESVLAQTYTFEDHALPAGVSQDVEDFGTVLVTCQGGKSALIEAAWLSNLGPTARVEVLGTRASLRLDPLTKATTHGEGDDACSVEERLLEDPAFGPLGPEAIGLATRDFISAIRQSRQPATSATEALTVMRVLAAAYESVAISGPVHLSGNKS